MAIIPKQHEKYNLLRNSANDVSRECFSYPNLSTFEKIGIDGLDPYGYSSVTEYNEMLSERIKNTTDCR